MPLYFSTTVRNAADLMVQITRYTEWYGKIDYTDIEATVGHKYYYDHPELNCPYRGEYRGRMHEGCAERGCKPCFRVRFAVFAGAVLSEHEHNHYDDSDFDAIVWDAVRGEVREVEWKTTRFPTYDNGCVVDATQVSLDAALAAWRKSILPVRIQQWEDKAKDPRTVTNQVEVVKGRRKKNGAYQVGWQGEVIHAQDSEWGWRVQIRPRPEFNNGLLFWESADNCRVIEIPPTPVPLIEERVSREVPDWYRQVAKEVKRAA